MIACLDSWAVLAWLQGAEPAAGRVEALLAEHRPTMSWINLGEVAYITQRAEGAGRAGELVRDLRRRLRLDDVTADRVLAASAVKADHPMAFADAFAVATAQALDVPLWTGDPEIIEAGLDVAVEDLRSDD